MDSYKRFSDADYRNWLQAAESLYILRSLIRDFVENETEKYHKSLQEKLKDDVCQHNCSLHKWRKPNKFPICNNCEKWKDEILNNHNHKGIDIPWSNCQSYRWPTDKWEVAKVYMLRGIKNHHSFDQLDISSILNFMNHCKHFKGFANGQQLTKVINVRNSVMHSPDFRFSKKELDDSIKNVLELAKSLENCVPDLKTISKNIQQFKNILKKCSEQGSQNIEDSKEETLKLLDREQQAMKEKIEYLAQRCEEDQDAELKNELQGMKDFLDQNKDLLENLRPQVNRLNEIQEKVEKHEEDINKLANIVDRLVAPDPVFSGDVLKFKNHVFEEARKRNMPEPEFTEETETSGYRGSVKVNGRTFQGSQVCINKKTAHQEVAKIALEYMKDHPEWKVETSEITSKVSESTSSSASIFYGVVTVVLNNQEVVSDKCVQEKEAIESAYRKLANQFGLTSLEGINFRAALLEHFKKCNFPPPVESPFYQDDKSLCKLMLSGPFTFYDEDGSLKKKQAEQQAAKVALQSLSGLLNCRSLANAGDNWKGFLKECLDAINLPQPDYAFTKGKVCTSQEAEVPTTGEDNSQISTTKEIIKNDSLQAKNLVNVVQDLPTVDTVSAVFETKTLDSSPPDMTSQAHTMSSTVYYGIVTVDLHNQEVMSDGFVQTDEAIDAAYKKLACQFGLSSLEGKAAVLKHFCRYNFPPPLELTICKDDKTFCKLQLCGPFKFSDKDGSSKKKLAEQQAAKVALRHLSGLFNWSFQAEAGKNYIGFLKERLEANGLKKPEYSFTTNREDVAVELESSSTNDEKSCLPTPHAISKNDSLLSNSSVTVVQDPPTASTGNVVDYQEMETLDSSSPEMPSQTPKMNSIGSMHYGIVTVVLNKQEVVSEACAQEEKAIDSAYRKLACQFGLTSHEGKAEVLKYFHGCNFPQPSEILVRENDKISCKLQLTGDFTFYDKDGSSKKQQAEQLAAKVALQQLSGLLNYSFEAEAGKNYKGILKECLDALQLENPVYKCKVKREASKEVESPSTSGDNSHSSCKTAISKTFCLQPNDSANQECLEPKTQDAIPSNKSSISDPAFDYLAIRTLLQLYNLKPPSVTVERLHTETILSCQVDINLDEFTFQNNNDYTVKKDAIRKTYFLLGNALGIAELDENNASMLVKQTFSQKSLPHPREDFEDKKCTLYGIKYNVLYDGKGLTEAEAKQDALQKALDALTLLFGFKSLPKCTTVEKTEDQINTLLRTKGQKELSYSHRRTGYKSSIELMFNNYSMESTREKKKKENANYLSRCILGLLAVETEPNTVSLRNCLDEWFKQRNLVQPVFENVGEARGVKVTFSVRVSCSNPNYEDSVEVAENKLAEELKKRLNHLTD
ncbi:uncharacterized protein si:ch211-91p5.3 [Clarias gariepinus]|uniref:uncharacterized protein si:ch211-91p5.3 n=1 Tax=Clarias gariepinus TaxID=13013 RepID=UPI00234DB6B5|nr:uncharacterized protein si:ch211-91p5.3 [Clarias gariepinus]